MKFAEGLEKAYQQRWSYINTFRVLFEFPDSLKKASGWTDEVDGRDINLHVISVDTPQFTNQPIEAFVANKWVIHNGRDELYRYTITFRDHNRMDLYRKFLAMYNKTKEDYYDNVKLVVKLYKDDDYFDEEEKLLLDLQGSIIEAVSQLQFSNTTENQIAEFSVNFKCNKPILQK